jgi:hypothetical protein
MRAWCEFVAAIAIGLWLGLTLHDLTAEALSLFAFPRLW